jgi:hypothetical protein
MSMHRMAPHADCEPGPDAGTRVFERILAGPVEPEVLAAAILAATPCWLCAWGPPAGRTRTTDMLLRDRE